eukprot:COSAG06_NODE_865_length_11872_cov_1867.177610_5_plen_203_part_00
MDAHEDPDPGDGAQPGWSGAVLLRMAQLDVATLDAGLELVTYRLVAVFGAMASADMGSMNARRAVVGTATATGTALLLLRACTAGSACATLAHFAYVLVMPATLQSMLIVHHLQLGINITAGQWVWYGTLVVAAATWSAARALCDGELRILGYIGFLLASVLVLQVPIVMEMRATHIVAWGGYLLGLCAILWWGSAGISEVS